MSAKYTLAVITDCIESKQHLHIEARTLLLHPALPLPFLATLELDPPIDTTQFERHTRSIDNLLALARIEEAE